MHNLIPRLSVMNVNALLPVGLQDYAKMYSARSALMPSRYAYTNGLTDPTFAEFVYTHMGTVCLSGVKGALAHLTMPKLRYVPTNAQLAQLRSKAYTTGLVLNRQLDLEVVPDTVVVYERDFVDTVSSMLGEHQAVFVRLGEHADGGYMSEVFHSGVRDSQLRAFLAEAKCPSYVVAPYISRIVADPGVGFTPKYVYPPNFNLSFSRDNGEIGTVGVALPYLNDNWWLEQVTQVGQKVQKFVREHAGSFSYANVDTMVLPDGSVVFCEINTRWTMSRLCVSGLWKTARHKGITRLDLDEYHDLLAKGDLGLAFVSCDKLMIGANRSTAQVFDMLAQAGIYAFDGKSGALPTHPWFNGHIGLILAATSDWGSSHAMHCAVDMYHKMLNVLGVPYHGELWEIESSL